ncbi:MAG: serpin family protein [Methanoregula sp.]|jgi:serpin B|nr:serpin family protein [Methanoregula sp.]
MELKTIGICTFASLVVMSMALAGCTGTIPVQPNAGNPTPESENSIVEANNRFAFDLYSHLAKDPKFAGDNIFFSPFSISSAVAITYEGARGSTADEIRSVFHYPENASLLRQGYSTIIADVNSHNASYTLLTANALWAEKTYPFLPGYINTAQTYYSANTTNLDFINDSDASRTTINRWVEEKTRNTINDLVPAGSITPLTRLVITDAVYFKGTWVRQFDKNKTRNADFRLSSGKSVPVPMMEITDEDAVYPYAETGTVHLLKMPYEPGKGNELSVLILLPKNDDLAAVEEYLDPDNLSELQNSSESRRVMVYLPKFTLETKYTLRQILAEMGMPTAFGDADFSGMDGTKYLYIHEIIHQAYVDVNEEGTEAAAATAVVMWGKGAVPAEGPVPVFRADHPFIFLIQDTTSGNILFMGRVENPNG